MKSLHPINSHDKYFKYLLSRKEEAKELIKKHLLPEIVAKIDFRTLKLNKTEYVDKRLKQSFSDIIYDCIYKSETKQGYIKIKISLLFEHKSTPYKYIHLQLLRYMLNIWEPEADANKQLTPVIPIVFYHGKEKWNFRIFHEYFGGIDKNLEEFLPKFMYQLIDVSGIDNEKIINMYQNIFLNTSILLMKNIHDKQKFEQILEDLIRMIIRLYEKTHSEALMSVISEYILSKSLIEFDVIVEKMKTISLEVGTAFATPGEKLLKHTLLVGKNEGIQEGIQKGVYNVAIEMLKQNMMDELIISVTKITRRELNMLKSNL